jgi:hypothetical protein
MTVLSSGGCAGRSDPPLTVFLEEENMQRAIIGLILFCCSLTFTVKAQGQGAATPSPSDLAVALEQLSGEIR